MVFWFIVVPLIMVGLGTLLGLFGGTAAIVHDKMTRGRK